MPKCAFHSIILILLSFGYGFADPFTVEWSLDSTRASDSWISFKFPNTPFGSADSMVVGTKGLNRRGLVRFNMPSVSPGDELISAELSLYVRGFKGTPGDSAIILVHRMNGDWVEGSSDTGGVTWNESAVGIPWTRAGGVFDTTTIASTLVNGPDVRAVWDITSLVQYWSDNPGSNFGLMLRSKAEIKIIDIEDIIVDDIEGDGGDGYIGLDKQGMSGAALSAINLILGASEGDSSEQPTVSFTYRPAGDLLPAYSSAVSEITPIEVDGGTSVSFRGTTAFDIALGDTDTGVDLYCIPLPAGFGNPIVASASYNGAIVPFSDRSNADSLIIEFASALSDTGVLDFTFNMDTPAPADPAVYTLSPYADYRASSYDPQMIPEGDANGLPGDSDRYRVTVRGMVTDIEVLPDGDTITADDSLQFSARGFDSGGSEISITPTWSLSGSVGTLDPASGLLRGSIPGSGYVIATVGGVVDSAAVTVTHGTPIYFAITPANPTTTTDDPVDFSAVGVDGDFNWFIPEDVLWTHPSGLGSIDADGLFTPTGIGSGIVVGASSGLADTANITIDTGTLASLEVSPATAVVSTDSSIQFSAVGRDALGFPLSDPGTLSWGGGIAIGAIDPASGLFDPTTVGSDLVQVTSGLITGQSGTIEVVAGSTASIAVAPRQLIIEVGKSSQFSATTYDADSNATGGTPSWAAAGGTGSISSQGLYTATTAGSGSVIATAGGSSDSATVTVLENGGLTIAHVIEDRDGVTRGEEDLSVRLALHNTTGSPVTGIEASLDFTAGGAAVSSEYTVVLIDAGKDTLADSARDTLLFRVDVDPLATIGEAVTIDAVITGHLVPSGTLVGNTDSNNRGEWTVTPPPVVIDLERSLFPTSAVAGQATGFWIGVRNGGGTSIQLNAQSILKLSDGATGFDAPLATAAILPADSSVVSLFFGSASMPVEFAPGQYNVDLDLEGTDGNGASFSTLLNTSTNSLNVLPPYILADPLVISGSLVSPAADSIPLLRLELINLYTGSRTLSSLTVTNKSNGTGTAAERDSIWEIVYLVADRDRDGVWDAADALLGTAAFDDSTADFGGFTETIAMSDTLHLLVFGDLSAARTPDGMELDVAVESSGDFGLDQGSIVETTFPADSPGSHFVDGFVAAQLLLTGSAPGDLPAGADDSLVMEILIPSNGFEADQLKSLTVENSGADEATSDITEVRLWSDGGNGAYDRGTGDDSDVGALFWTGNAWTRTGIDLNIPFGGKLLFVTLDIAETPEPGSVVQFSVPVGGVQMASSNDGPIDMAPLSPLVRVIGGATGLVLSDVQGSAQSTVQPGAEDVELLRFTLSNLDSTGVRLLGLTLLNQSSSQSGDPDSILSSLTLTETGSGSPLSTLQFDGGGASFNNISLDLPPSGSVSLSIRAVVGTGCVSDGDLIRIRIVDESSFLFDSTRVIIGPFPVESPSDLVLDGLAAAQVAIHDIDGGALTPASTDRVALQITIPRNGCIDDVLQSIEVDNHLGSAGTSDIARVYLTTGLPPHETYVDNLAFIGSSWIRANLNLPIQEGGLPVSVRIDMTADATDSRTVQLRVPVDGIVVASSNDGPVDEPVISPALFVVSDAPLFASFDDDLPAVVSMGEEFDVTMKVENLGDSLTLNNARPDSFGTSGPAVTIVEEPPPDSVATLLPGENARFTWRVKADTSGSLRFIGNAVGRTGDAAMEDTTFLVTSGTMLIQVPPDSVMLDAVSTFPVSILRGDQDVPAMRLTIAHGNSESDRAPIEIRALTLAVDDGAGSAISPGDFLESLTLSDNAGVLGTAPYDSLHGGAVTIPFPNPIVLEPEDERSIDLSLNLGGVSDVVRFRLLFDPENALHAVDANSGVEVELAGDASITSSTVEIVDPPAGLNVTVYDILPDQINRGAPSVPLFDFDLASVETPGNPAEITVSRLTIVFGEETFPYDSIAITQRGTPAPHFAGSEWTRVDSLLHFDLDPAIVIPPDITVEIELAGSVSPDAPLGPVQFGVSDSLFISPVGAGQLLVDVHLILNEALETVVVERTDSIDVVAEGPADTALAVPGSVEREAFHLTVNHNRRSDLSDITVDLLRFHLENSAGDSVEVLSLFDRARVVHDGEVIASVAPLTFGAATLNIPLDAIAPFELSAGDGKTLDLDVDVRSNAPPGDYFFVVSAGDLVITEQNEEAEVAVVLESSTGDQLKTGPFKIRRQSEGVLYWVDLDLPPTTVSGVVLDDAARLRVLAAGGNDESSLHLESLTFRTEDREGSVFDPGEMLTRAELYFAESEEGYPATLAGDRIHFLFDPPVELIPGDTADISLNLELAQSVSHPSFRIAFAPDDIGMVEEEAGVARSGNDTGQSPSLFAHLAARKFGESLRSYPNPFSSRREETTIAFYARSSCRAMVRIFTGLGIAVRTYEIEVQAAGLVEVKWDGKNGDGNSVLSGVYLGSIELIYQEGGRDHAVHKIAVLN